MATVKPEPNVRFRTTTFDKIVAKVEGPRAHAARNTDVIYVVGSGKNARVFTETKPYT
jgi:hypothetical protein